MQRAKHPVLSGILAASLIMAGLMPVTGQANSVYAEERPGELATIGDAVFVRPVMLVVTGLGLVAFTASLPFSALGGNVDEAGERLVKAPARSTFLRCLGCTPAQHEQRRAERRTERANR
ncbi:hypothetical protein [Isoalcanivorax indicus]|uniref:hypothetical protein n=1 Tax=Isoalcanivorax indicus TaxID=2202653 RepID=UPI000DB9756A|nr:hypothetical protein [Isoalcanivorax indicus]